MRATTRRREDGADEEAPTDSRRLHGAEERRHARGARGRLAGATLAVTLLALGGSLATVAATPTGATTRQPAGEETNLPPANPQAPGRIIIPHRNLPDPFVLEVKGHYYLYSSQTGFLTPPASVTESIGASLTRFGPTRAAMSSVPSWAETGFTWSPDVRFIDGRYVMYFNAWAKRRYFFDRNETGNGQRAECIGVATSKRPSGPFVPVKAPPLVCQFRLHGAIDPRSFLAPDGRLYLVWKSDDNAFQPMRPTHLFSQLLSKNGERLVGPRHLLMTGTPGSWSGGLIEAPDMVYVDQHYFLFFSGSWFNGPGYSIGDAVCKGPAGPCYPLGSSPWLGSNTEGFGPGEESLFHNAKGWWMVYSPWCLDGHTYRPVALARVAFGFDGPYLVKLS